MKRLNLKEQPRERLEQNITDYLNDLSRLAQIRLCMNLLKLYKTKYPDVPSDWAEHDIVMEVEDWFRHKYIVNLNVCGEDQVTVETFKVLRFKISCDDTVYLELENLEGEITLDDIPIKYLASLCDQISEEVYSLSF